jgi:hypothetical protein
MIKLAQFKEAEVRGVVAALIDTGILPIETKEQFEKVASDTGEMLSGYDYDLADVANAAAYSFNKQAALLGGAIGGYRTYNLSDEDKAILRKAHGAKSDEDLLLRNVARGAVGGLAGSLAATIPAVAIARYNPWAAGAVSAVGSGIGGYLASNKYSKKGVEEAKRLLEQRRKREEDKN